MPIRSYGWIILLWLGTNALTFVFAMVIHRLGGAPEPWPDTRMAIESIIFLAFLILLVTPSAFREVFTGLGRVRLILLAMLVGMIFVGQHLDSYRATYPFSAWNMYGQPHPSSSYAEFIAEYESGSEGQLPFHELHPSPSPRSIMWRLERLARQGYVNEPDEKLQQEYQERMRTLMEIHNARQSDNPIRAVRLMQCTIPIDAYTGRDSIECTLLVRVEVER